MFAQPIVFGATINGDPYPARSVRVTAYAIFLRKEAF